MGNCTYCKQKAGFLRYRHGKCTRIHKNGKRSYVDEILRAMDEGSGFNQLAVKLQDIQTSSFIKHNEADEMMVKGFELLVEKFLDDDLLSQEEEKRAVEFKKYFELTQTDLDKNGAYTRVIMSAVLRDLAEGVIPESRVNIQDRLPFLFQKSEKPIWCFQNVEYYEQKTRTEYVGGSHGISVRLAKGLYYRTSSYRGRPVKIEEMKYAGTGSLVITSKHIYFGSDLKKFKIPFRKIISITPYNDGIGLHKEGVSAKPQIFKNVDSWFVHNAISYLNQV